jgi:hypothetical protein
MLVLLRHHSAMILIQMLAMSSLLYHILRQLQAAWWLQAIS